MLSSDLREDCAVKHWLSGAEAWNQRADTRILPGEQMKCIMIAVLEVLHPVKVVNLNGEFKLHTHFLTLQVVNS